MATATSRQELRSDVAEALAAEDGVLSGEQLRELVRWEASQLGMTYTEATRAAARGDLPAEASDLRDHIAILGLKVR